MEYMDKDGDRLISRKEFVVASKRCVYCIWVKVYSRSNVSGFSNAYSLFLCSKRLNCITRSDLGKTSTYISP